MAAPTDSTGDPELGSTGPDGPHRPRRPRTPRAPAPQAAPRPEHRTPATAEHPRPADAIAPGAGSPPAEASKPAKKPRDPLLDNARAILIMLVVVGHTLEKIDTPLADTIYTWIYSFHMPAFVAISGFLSRSYRNEPRQVARLLTSMLIPYLIFQVIHAVEHSILSGDPLSVDLWHASWTLWFLLALAFWRIFTPLLRVLKYPLVLTVAISVLAPLDADLDSTLTWARVLSFLPFFMLGLACTPQMLARVRDLRGGRVIGSLALLAALVVAALTRTDFSNHVFTMSTSYDGNDFEAWYGIVTRVMALVCGAILTVALVMVSPRGQHWFTNIGVQSLTIYLVHPVILQIPRALDWSDAVTTSWQTVLAIIVALGLLLVLSRAPVVRVLSWVTSPPLERLLVRDALPAPSAAGGQRDSRQVGSTPHP